MKVLVFAYELVICGTVVNAIDLAAALRDLHNWDVVVFATPGPLLKMLEEKGLRYIAAPKPRGYPSLARMRALREAVRSEKPDLIHVWDWQQAIDAYYAVHLLMQVPMLVTDMCSHFSCLLPKRLPTTYGTPELADRARTSGWRQAKPLLPPVDIHLNAPDAVDVQSFRAQYKVRSEELILTTVSRLDDWMKGESLFRTVDVVQELGRNLPLRFFVVGDGSARARLAERAQQVNTELGREAVTLTGPLLDPRPAYAVADIVIGMGGSALRGMAFAKPVIVVGEKNFSAPLSPESAPMFLYKGMYGIGDGETGNALLRAQVQKLATSVEERRTLSQFSRDFVTRHFSLEAVSADLVAMGRQAVNERHQSHVAAVDGIRTAAVYFKERRFLARP